MPRGRSAAHLSRHCCNRAARACSVSFFLFFDGLHASWALLRPGGFGFRCRSSQPQHRARPPLPRAPNLNKRRRRGSWFKHGRGMTGGAADLASQIASAPAAWPARPHLIVSFRQHSHGPCPLPARSRNANWNSPCVRGASWTTGCGRPHDLTKIPCPQTRARHGPR